MSNPTDHDDAVTARPWTQYCNDNTIYGATGLFVAIVQSANKLADTAFIVKSVNNHDRLNADNAELIACLEETGPMLDALHEDWQEEANCEPYQPILDMIKQIKSLLARLDAAAGKDL